MLDYDREAARYDATRGGDARADAAAHAIEMLLPAAARGVARIADVGCGTGIVTVRLLGPGRSVIGIDRSAGMAAMAAGRLPGRITLGSVIRLPLASGSVDVVVMVWLLHLLAKAEAAAAVAEAGRVLAPGGLLVTTVGKNDAAFDPADDAAAILGPVRARFDHGQADRLDRVLAVVRRPLGVGHPKLEELVVADPGHLEGSEDRLAGFDACFFCLGVSSSGMKEADYEHVTYGFTLAAAETPSHLLRSSTG